MSQELEVGCLAGHYQCVSFDVALCQNIGQ
jgi:hypothetical protein